MEAWNQYGAGRSKIPVLIVEVAPFLRSVPVEQRKIDAGEMKQRFAEVGDAIPVAIPCDGDDISVAVDRGGPPRLPKRRLPPVWRAVENRCFVQRGWVVFDHPALIVTRIGVRSEGDVQQSVSQHQARPLQLLKTVECDGPVVASCAGPRYRRRNLDWPAEHLMSVDQR